jgi:signal transduction histidine kinase
MIRWGFPVLLCALVASGFLLRRWPLVALVVTLAGSAVISVAPRSPLPPSALLVLAVCAAGIEICYLAATRTRKVSVPAVALAGAGLPILILEVPTAGTPFSYERVGSTVPLVTVAVPLVMIIAWLIGNSIRQAHAQAELARTQAAAQTALAERLRIARELHDIVAHSIGIIAIQAGSGRSVCDASPAEARDALAAIEATSRETLSGLRRMMTGLRHAGPGPGPDQAPLGPGQALDPAPGLADLERLAATTRDAGVRVEVDWQGSREPLPPDIDLSAFRIIQEAVTNVVRHAGTGQCRVSITQRDGHLSIEVTDGGRGGAVTGTGFGITGMRERATLLGGDFSAGPRPDGGFRVAAKLPLPEAAPAAAPAAVPGAVPAAPGAAPPPPPAPGR